MHDPESMRRKLEAFLAGDLPRGQLILTYDDLHGLHGGLRLVIRGTGKVEQESVRYTVYPPRDRIDASGVDDLVRLLLETEAWQQLEPDRMAVPDESRASLYIQAGSESSQIWEWYNNLEKNGRLIRIRDAMTALAWDTSAEPHGSWPQILFRCPACGTETEVEEDPSRMIEATQEALEKLTKFEAEVDPGQFCPHCRGREKPIKAVDLRELDQPGYPSIRIILRHPGLKQPEAVLVGGEGEARILVRILNGDWDSYYLDPEEEGLPGGTPRLRKWYVGLHKRVRTARPVYKKHSVEPLALDFGKVVFHEPVRKVLRLINPEDRPVKFSVLGVLGFPELEGVKLPRLPFKLPYRYDFDRVAFERDWILGKFTVAPRSELTVPIAVDICPETSHANNELQISTSYPPAQEIVSRFAVRIIHRGPKGWS
ncbi:MAG: hypothetical protein JXR96_17070 [Deltaproteobacteria bacterium]|nr:hypothetical protein [Deltaproteobacteria bacterium]